MCRLPVTGFKNSLWNSSISECGFLCGTWSKKNRVPGKADSQVLRVRAEWRVRGFKKGDACQKGGTCACELPTLLPTASKHPWVSLGGQRAVVVPS